MNRFRTLLLVVMVVGFTACEVELNESPEHLFSKAEERRQAADYTQALRLYHKAATRGHGEAQVMLGAFYQTGAFPTKDRFVSVLRTKKMDPHSAEKWYRRAVETLTEPAAAGEPKAQYMLGMLYMNGKGVDLDFDEARRLFEEAARQGEAKAYFNLGWLNFLENDDEASAASFQQAAELGHLPAYYMLAFHYLHGRGIEQSVVKYAETLQAAIDKGSAEAQLEWHTFLKSVRQNAAAGDEEATQNLHVLEESGLI